jgi:hypothetical protein
MVDTEADCLKNRPAKTRRVGADGGRSSSHRFSEIFILRSGETLVAVNVQVALDSFFPASSSYFSCLPPGITIIALPVSASLFVSTILGHTGVAHTKNTSSLQRARTVKENQLFTCLQGPRGQFLHITIQNVARQSCSCMLAP